MRQNWVKKRLGEVLANTEMIDPTKMPNKEFIYIDVSSVNKESKEIEGGSIILGKDAPSRARKLVRTDDVIFATVRPTHGRAALITEEYNEQVCSTGYLVLRGKENIYFKYLYYFLLSDEFIQQMEMLQKGASYPAVTDSEVKNVILHYPESLPEQHRIVSILDQCFAAIDKAKANAEQNLKNVKELFESYLQGVFEKKGDGWKVKTLEELADKNCTLSYGIVQPGNDYPNGLPIVRPTDLTTKYIKLDGLKRIDPKLADGYKRTKLIGDELLLCVRGTTGVISIATPEIRDGNVTRGIVPIRFNSTFVSQDFGYYLLISNYVQKQIRAKTYGTALMQINIGDLRKVLTPYPPLIEQQTIVRKIDAIHAETQKLETVYRQKLLHLEELRKSLLQKAFAGELTSEVVNSDLWKRTKTWRKSHCNS